MRSPWHLVLATALLVAGVTSEARSADLYVNPDGECGGSLPCYTTIQAAINAASPGDVIYVQAATYPETILINKALALLGAGAASTAIDVSANPAAGTTVTVTGVTGNVTIDGFKIVTGPASTVDSNALSITSIGAGSLITVTNNELWCVQSSAGTANQNYGLIAGYGSAGTLFFDHNTVYGGGDNPVLIERWAGPVTFSYNTVYRGPDDNITGGKDAIFVMNYGATNITAKQIFDHNTIDLGGGTIFDNAHRATGLSVVAQQTGGAGPGGFTDVEITNNQFVNLKPFRRGCGLWDNSSGAGDVIALIKGNTVSAAAGFTGDHGIRLLGGVTGTVVTENDISGVDIAFQARPWNGFDPTGFTVHGNRLLGGVLAVDNQTASTLDASANWWGSNSQAAVAAAAGATTDYTPWLDVGTDMSANPGFQGSYSILHVDDASPQVGTTGIIQEGIDLVTASTVLIGPGSYPGTVLVNKKVTLQGAGDGANPAVDSVLLPAAGAVGVEIQVGGAGASDRCVIRDLRISGGGYGLRINNVLGYVTLLNLTATGTSNQGFEIHNTASVTDLVMTDVDLVNNLSSAMRVRGQLNGLTMTNGHLDGNVYGLQSYTGIGEGNNFLNVSVTGTTFNNNTSKGMYFEKLSDALFNGIAVVNSGTAGLWASGIDMNLKYTAYQNIEIRNSTISGCGGGDVTNGVGITIKARDDGSYSTYPAALTNVDLVGNTITTCQNGIRLGEPTKNNAGPTLVDVHQNQITASVAAGLINATQATPNADCNWWGHVNGPHVPPANPNPGINGISGAAIYAPWWTTATGPCNGYGINYVTASTTGLPCLSTVTSCVTVPVIFNRADSSPARAATVTFALSADLELCAGTPIVPGTWLSGYNSSFQVVDHGGGVYTVDQAILGQPCGVSTGGQLFTVDVQKKVLGGNDGVGTITVTAVSVRDCGNPFVILPGIPGAPGSITIDTVPPTAIATLAATQLLSGNDADGTTKINLSYTIPVDGVFFEVWRKGFGYYPEYDDAGGAVPAVPVTYPPTGWTNAYSGATPPAFDEPATRDYWYYVIYTKDACGNRSPISNMTAGTLNYHLGDVAPGSGNNQVTTADISALGASYGSVDGGPFYVNTIDVGPTSNNSTYGRPLTDNIINFEDLLMFAINYGTVSLTAPPEVADVASANPGLALVTEPVAGGVLARLVLTDNANVVKGLHALVDFDRAGLILERVEQGDLLGAQAHPVFFHHLDEGAAGIHAALLGNGEAIRGSGEVARLHFRGHGTPALILADMRDITNQQIGQVAAGIDAPAAVVPLEFALRSARPNPFNPSTMIGFALPEAGRVDLAIYDVRGRLVRTLVAAELPAGEHTAFWDGRDARGAGTSSGVYIVRLTSAGREATQKIQLMK